MAGILPGLPAEIARECLVRIPYNHFCTATMVSKLWKEEIQSPAFHELRKVSGLSRAIVVLAQAEPGRGFGAVKYPTTPAYRLALYAPASGTWDRLPPVPGFPDGLPLFCQVAGVGRNLVVIGGWSPATWEASGAVFVYDFVAGNWRCGTSMPGPPRSFFACASDSDRTVFIAGGHDDEKNVMKSALAYDVAKDEWAPLPDMVRERDECKGVFQGGRFHVIGGYNAEFEKSSEAFDRSTWQWDRVEEDVLEVGTCPRNCVAGDEGTLYRCRGGNVAVKEGATWRVVAELPADARAGPYVVTWQGRLFLSGSVKNGGPHVAYTLESDERKSYNWKKVEGPEEYSGHVQGGCFLEI